MVEAVRAGELLRAVARRFRVSLCTVQRWVQRANGQPLDAVDWSGRAPIAHAICRTPAPVEDQILAVRRRLREESALGEYGAPAIHREFQAQGVQPLPSVRTIGRILERRGALDGRRRIRRPPPPAGWYLPDVVLGRAELDSVDAIEDHTLLGGVQVDVLTCVSLHGGLPGAWPGPTLTSKRVIQALIAHWQSFGLPTYAQFDNAPVFTGAQRYANVLGQVVRACLGLEVVPVFVPAHESGFQAAIESLNGRWQAKVWHRFYHDSPDALTVVSDRYLAAYRQRLAPRVEAAPPRRGFPPRWHIAREPVPHGRIVYLRRTDEHGRVSVLGQSFLVSATWPHRLVRCEVALSAGHVSFYALRRRQPDQQPLLRRATNPWDLRAPWH